MGREILWDPDLLRFEKEKQGICINIFMYLISNFYSWMTGHTFASVDKQNRNYCDTFS